MPVGGWLNPYITKSKVVVLAGAGASAALGKWTMKAFLDELVSRIQPETEERHALSLVNRLHPESEDDLEVLIDGVHDLRTVEDVIALEGEETHLIPSIVSLTRASALLRRRIYDMIIDHYASVDPQQAMQLHSPMWQAVTDFDTSSNFIPVFTTNYDWGFETLAHASNVNLIDGFATSNDLVGTWSRTNYDRQVGRRPARSRDMALFKLHGSTSWYRSNGRIEKHNLNQTLPNMTTALIYPGRVKVESLDEPFQTSYQYFGACLRNAEILVVIGYKFGDLTIHRLLESALAEGAGFKTVVINGPNFSWDTVAEPERLADRSVIIAESYAPTARDSSGVPFYCSQLRGHLGLSPYLRYEDSVAPTEEFGSRRWLHLTVHAATPGRIHTIGVTRPNVPDLEITPGKESGLVVLLQTKTRTAFSTGLNYRKGTQHIYLGIPDTILPVQRAYIVADGVRYRTSIRIPPSD